MWDNVTSILITLRLAACLNSLRLKHVWSRSVLHTFIVVVEFAPDTEDLQTSWTGHTEKKKKKQESTTNLNTQKQSEEIREWGKKKKKLSALYLAEILQRRVWNVVASPGKFREDSGAGPLQPQTPCGRQIQLLCPLQLLWILSFSASHGQTESLQLLSAARTSTEKGEKVVWLLFPWMMSHPDFVSAVRLCLCVGVCVEDL